MKYQLVLSDSLKETQTRNITNLPHCIIWHYINILLPSLSLPFSILLPSVFYARSLKSWMDNIMALHFSKFLNFEKSFFTGDYCVWKGCISLWEVLRTGGVTETSSKPSLTVTDPAWEDWPRLPDHGHQSEEAAATYQAQLISLRGCQVQQNVSGKNRHGRSREFMAGM